jgi:hypothetical protein
VPGGGLEAGGGVFPNRGGPWHGEEDRGAGEGARGEIRELRAVMGCFFFVIALGYGERCFDGRWGFVWDSGWMGCRDMAGWRWIDTHLFLVRLGLDGMVD